MARVLGKSILGILAAVSAAGAASAQSELFDEGVKAYRLGRFEEAREKIGAYIATDPTNEEAFELFKRVDHRVWQVILEEDEQLSRMAKHLLELATLGRAERSRDEDRIAELAAAATTGDDYGVRRDAVRELSASHGEFAVPALVESLSNSDDNDAQVYAIWALQQIGRAATLPLIEVLDADELTRRNAVAVLAHTRDERARASLTVLANRDPSDAVREAATAALRAMGASMEANAAHLFVADAQRYLVPSGVRDSEISEVVWKWQDGALVSEDVPAAVYGFELAKKAAHRALPLDPNSADAKAVLARAYLSQAAAIQETLAANPDDEGVAALAERVPALGMMAAATGLPVLRRAVADSIDDGMVATAVAGISMLGDLEDPADLEQSPLVDALDSGDSRIAYAAALAITKASAGGSVPAASRVVANLSQAVTERQIRRVKIIDRNPITHRAALEGTFAAGTQTTVSASPAAAMNDLYSFPNVDVVVLADDLGDTLPDTVIRAIRKNDRLADTKILVLTGDPDTASEHFGDRIDGTIQGPASGDALRQAIDAALADAEPDPLRARADAVAVSASEALFSLASSQIDVTAALANLTAQLGAGRSDQLTIPAARAIGAGGALGQVEALLQVLQDDTASLDLKVECANAIGGILSRSGEVGAEVLEPMMAVVASEADIELRRAVVGALGKGNLGADAQLRLIDALQVSAGIEG